jgi:Protein of unknown function (DUF1118)
LPASSGKPESNTTAVSTHFDAHLSSPPHHTQAATTLAPRAAAATTRLKPAAKPKAKPAAAKPKAGTLKIGGDKKPAAAPAAGGTRKVIGRGRKKKPRRGSGAASRFFRPSSTDPSSHITHPQTQITAISVGQKNAQFQSRTTGGPAAAPPPRILTRVQQLRLLSKVEQAGLLSALEKSGVTLSTLEKSGALSLAENLGLLSRAADRGTPGLLYTAAAALFAAGPAAVYAIPDSSPALVAVQALIAAVAVAGGSAAFGGASLLSALQK